MAQVTLEFCNWGDDNQAEAKVLQQRGIAYCEAEGGYMGPEFTLTAPRSVLEKYIREHYQVASEGTPPFTEDEVQEILVLIEGE